MAPRSIIERYTEVELVDVGDCLCGNRTAVGSICEQQVSYVGVRDSVLEESVRALVCSIERHQQAMRLR